MLTTEHVIEMAANSGTNTPALIVCALFVWTISSDKRTKRVAKILNTIARIFNRRK